MRRLHNDQYVLRRDVLRSEQASVKQIHRSINKKALTMESLKYNSATFLTFRSLSKRHVVRTSAAHPDISRAY